MILENNLTSKQLLFIEKWKNQGFNVDGSVEVENGKLFLDIFLSKLTNVVPITFHIFGPVEGFQKADFGIIDKILQKMIDQVQAMEKSPKSFLKTAEKNIEELNACKKFGEDFARRNLKYPGQFKMN